LNLFHITDMFKLLTWTNNIEVSYEIKISLINGGNFVVPCAP
jgi:hypothetical protein